MNRYHRYYDVSPRIVQAGRDSEIAVQPLFGHCRFSPDGSYQVVVWPLEGAEGQTTTVGPQPVPFSLANGVLRFRYCFAGEQEYAVLLQAIAGDSATLVAEFRVYALGDDLFARRPYKGEAHIHTHHSDGWESPAYVAASCRRIGLDFAAITDHRRYAPSLEAIRALEGLPVDLRLYPGEEIHPPDNPVHMVNFGGRFSINELFQTPAYRQEVEATRRQLADIPPGVDRYTYASCVWCFDMIRAAGGLGVFCHPYWLSGHRYDVPVYLTDMLFERQPFDALELVGGYRRFEAESNVLQIARYHEERARGKRIPIVGGSDAHGCERGELFGWYCTVAFAHSTDLADVIQSIRGLYSVAVEALPGETARAFGPFRLVKYTQFLLREVFPLHDELCVEEGRLMMLHAAGDTGAADALAGHKGRTAALYDHLWGAG